MSEREVELEVGKNTEGFWVLSVDNVIVAQSRIESLVRSLADKVKELNEEVTFHVVG